VHYSPNAEEALGLLADLSPVSKSSIERACKSFLDLGVGPTGTGTVIIRSGSLGAYVASREKPGMWIEAYWSTEERVVDVTGDYLSPRGERPDAYQLPAIKARAIVS
jgi:sugar/nucleoside kinase (ribokinase family)